MKRAPNQMMNTTTLDQMQGHWKVAMVSWTDGKLGLQVNEEKQKEETEKQNEKQKKTRKSYTEITRDNESFTCRKWIEPIKCKLLSFL